MEKLGPVRGNILRYLMEAPSGPPSISQVSAILSASRDTCIFLKIYSLWGVRPVLQGGEVAANIVLARARIVRFIFLLLPKNAMADAVCRVFLCLVVPRYKRKE